MTPRPADEARRALREARERGETTDAEGEGDRGASTSPPPPPSSPSAPAQGQEDDPGREPAEHTPPRPGDIARAALRGARTARQAGAHGAADLPGTPPDEPDAAEVPPQERQSPADPAGPKHRAKPAGSAAQGDRGVPGEPTCSGDRGPVGEPAAPGEKTGRCDDRADADGSRGPGDPDGVSLPGSVGAGSARPADVAREALRAARRQAKADAASEGGSAKSAAHARRSSPPAGRQRRAGGSGTSDARARAVRDFAAGAFRLPPEADPAEEAPPAGESPGAAAAQGRATAHQEQAPSPGAVPASPAAGPASHLEGPDSDAERSGHSQRPSEVSGVGPAAVSTPASPEAGRASHPEGPDSHAERSGHPQRPSGVPGMGPADGAASASPEAGPGPDGQGSDAEWARRSRQPSGVPGGDFVGGAASAALRAGYASRPEGPEPDAGGSRRPQQPSAAGRRAFAAPSPAQPRAPRSMAAPDRDGDLRRTFPALPPRKAADEGFAGTWWGNAWVTALEEGALDAARLERGRRYAERGRVDAITVTPGLALAYVQGSRARPYRVQVRLRTLGDADWDRFLDAAVERPGHIAALLDKELPHSLADLADRGVPLLPGPGDLTPQCSCPDSGHPCKHAAALCYQTARLLDADPFVLLLLRGRGERALLDALSRRNAARAARAAQDRGPAPLPGVRAGEALTPRALPPLPAPLPAPPHPEQPPAYPAAPGGPDPFALDQLATDAAARAHALLTTGRDPVGGLTLWQDAVRLAAARPGSGLTAGTRALYASLASAAGRDTAELARAVAAWRQGGPEGLDVLEEPWDPPAGRFDRARPLLLAADLPAFRPWRNRLTHPRGHVQLRLGRVGLWFAYESEPGREDWWPRGTPDLDPVGALTGLGTRVDL